MPKFVDKTPPAKQRRCAVVPCTEGATRLVELEAQTAEQVQLWLCEHHAELVTEDGDA